MLLSFAASIFVLQCYLLEPANLYIVVMYVAKIENLFDQIVIKFAKSSQCRYSMKKVNCDIMVPRQKTRKESTLKKYSPIAAPAPKNCFSSL